MSFYINKKLNFKKTIFLDTIHENIKVDNFSLLNDNKFIIKKSKTCQDLIKECYDKKK